MVALTNQPYVFTNDNPLNAADALGLSGTMLPWGSANFGIRSGPMKVSASETINTIVKALQSNKLIQSLDLSGVAIKGLAKQLANDMYQNRGRMITGRMASALEGAAGIGTSISRAAGAAGVLLNISSDLAKGDSPKYIAGDVVSQFAAGAAAGAWAAGACSESGPGAVACGVVGFAVGYMAASTTAMAYKYAFHGH